MAEEIKYYTGNCITDLHTDTSSSHCNEEKCKQYIKSDGLKFCMSSVCPEKDCIYALANKLHQTIDRLEQENSLLSYNLHIKEGEAEHYLKEVGKYRSALGEINKIAEPRFVNGLNEEADLCNLAMDRIQTKINEVLNDK